VDLRRIEGAWSSQENLEAINPDFWTRDEKYTENCGNCAVAYELRHQGYDVEAKPNLTGGGVSIDKLADMFDGAKVQNAAGLSTTKDIYEMMAKVEHNVLTWGEGARGAIRGEWSWMPDGKAGHLFSLEIRNGEVKYDDGQSARKNVKHLERMKPQSIQYVRLDNTKPNDKVTTAVQNRRQ
jgi:hypothetical protein